MIINNKISSLILSVTDSCNLSCKYCFVQHQPHYMDFNVAKQSIDIFFKNPMEKYDLTFFGGEPLLCWDQIIIPIVNYCEKKDLNVAFHITSNGTLLDEKKLQYMSEHHISLLLSLDGNKETQDYNRPTKNGESSFDLIINKLPLIKKYLPTTTIRGTIYPDTCHLLFKNLLFCVEHGFTNLYFTPDEFSNWTDSQIISLTQEIRKYTIYYINSYRKQINPFIFSPFQEMLFNIHNKNYNNKSCQTCGLGFSTLSINYEGKFFGCQELTSYDENNNIYYLGDIESGFLEEKYNQLKQLYLEHSVICIEPELCNNCNYSSLCNIHYCHANSFLHFKNLYTKSKIKCIWDNCLFTDALACYHICLLNNNKYFISNYKQMLINKEGG